MDNDVNADVVEARFILVFFFLIWKQKGINGKRGRERSLQTRSAKQERVVFWQ
jgi:hypothetical protein